MGNLVDTGELAVELAKEYDDAQKAGKHYISSQWKYLKEETKSHLTASGCYNKHGKSIDIEPFSSDEADEVDSLEHQIGYLHQCANSKLSSRSENFSVSPSAAYSKEVLNACSNLLYSQKWHDPIFLRLALRAYRMYSMIDLMGLGLIPRLKNESNLSITVSAVLRVVFVLLAITLTIAAPLFIALALTSAAKGELAGSATALYAIAFTIYLLWALTTKIKKQNYGYFTNRYDFELEYNEWKKLDYFESSWCSTGAGARFYLEGMARKGINITPIAIDLCAALESSLFGKHKTTNENTKVVIE